MHSAARDHPSRHPHKTAGSNAPPRSRLSRHPSLWTEWHGRVARTPGETNKQAPNQSRERQAAAQQKAVRGRSTTKRNARSSPQTQTNSKHYDNGEAVEQRRMARRDSAAPCVRPVTPLLSWLTMTKAILYVAAHAPQRCEPTHLLAARLDVRVEVLAAPQVLDLSATTWH